MNVSRRRVEMSIRREPAEWLFRTLTQPFRASLFQEMNRTLSHADHPIADRTLGGKNRILMRAVEVCLRIIQ